jgi:hypothetical protein
MVLAYPSKKSQNHGKISLEKFSRPFLYLLDKFSSKMMFLNSKKTFQSMGSEYSLRPDLKDDLRRTRGAKKITKTVLKTQLKAKQTTYILVFVEYLMVSFKSV